MPAQPPAPDSLPQYLAEGVPTQDDTDLRALQKWIDDLFEYSYDIYDIDERSYVRKAEVQQRREGDAATGAQRAAGSK